MALIDYDAIRTAAAMRSAQRAYDNLAEPEPTPAGVICEQIRLAEGELHNAWAAMQLDNADAARADPRRHR